MIRQKIVSRSEATTKLAIAMPNLYTAADADLQSGTLRFGIGHALPDGDSSHSSIAECTNLLWVAVKLCLPP
jgi:hypothetical protein